MPQRKRREDLGWTQRNEAPQATKPNLRRGRHRDALAGCGRSSGSGAPGNTTPAPDPPPPDEEEEGDNDDEEPIVPAPQGATQDEVAHGALQKPLQTLLQTPIQTPMLTPMPTSTPKPPR